MRGRTTTRLRTSLVGAIGAAALVAGVGIVATSNPARDEIRLAQAADAQDNGEGGNHLTEGTAVDIDLKQVIEAQIGQAVPAGTEIRLTGLPDGLVQEGWHIKGTPTKSGLFNVHVSVTANGQKSEQDFQIMVAPKDGEAPGGIVTRPGESPAPSATSGDNGAGEGAHAGQGATGTETSGTETSGADNSGTDNSETETSPAATTSAAAPSGATTGTGTGTGAGTGASGTECTSNLTRGLEQVLPLAMGNDPESQGTAKLIASLLGTLLPTVLGAASSGNDALCGANAATGSVVDGADSLGQLPQAAALGGPGQGGATQLGNAQGMTTPGAQAGNGTDLQGLMQVFELANSILSQTSPR